jgi:hypothetical protein
MQWLITYYTFKVKTNKMRTKNIERKMGRPRKNFGCHHHNVLFLNPRRKARITPMRYYRGH